ncbi:transmembrane Fragile-X-F protein [Rummeliibacillus sp. POC4]|uniref:transmembrane Fragile-X-F protein n=1 Tax=Rummeliibacillus sp. POC4 TaxID=2305899 RepID=UPI000E66434E|nr:transmembrane Fragile-X-F protein [Rummeliibacillus sp. POC4]RIJ65519.1 transmembrane Fragile-X-F protein [Rummeliibacillus sp. POC4]
MGVTELLTIIFVVLKLTDTVTWSWWIVLLPELIAVGIYLILFIVWLVLFIIAIIKVRV